MLFNPVHTALSQQASARKASVETTNLIGHWDPNDSDSYGGSGTTYNNLVTSKEDLKIYGATFAGNQVTDPYHFAFDGTNDKISDIDVTDPYNDNFEIRSHYSWAISMWVKFDNFTNTNKLWAVGEDGDALRCTMQSGDDPHALNSKATPAVWCAEIQTIPPALSAGEWYMITWRHTPLVATTASRIDIFYDGVLQDCLHYDTSEDIENNWTRTWGVLSNNSTMDLDIGWWEYGDGEYVTSATKIGAILVYEAADICLPNSAVWSNYLATKGGVGSGGPWSYK